MLTIKLLDFNVDVKLTRAGVVIDRVLLNRSIKLITTGLYISSRVYRLDIILEDSINS